MRAFLAVLCFELRLHLRAPLTWTLLAIFFLIHLLTIAGLGIHINDNQLVHVNSAYMIVRTELVLGLFGMVPAIYFVVNAATRDLERGTLPLFFTAPVGRTAWLSGRLLAGTAMAALAGLAGICGMVAGTMLPTIDPARLGAFAWQPYAVSGALLVLPNAVVLCALFFTVAVLSRSVALSFGLALALVVAEVVLNANAAAGVPAWLVLADPFGALAVNEASRYWTIADFNARLPIALLPANRLLWLGIATFSVWFTIRRFRMDLAFEEAGRAVRLTLRRSAHARPVVRPALPGAATPAAGRASALRQLISTLMMDMRGVFLTPLVWLVLLLAVVSTVSDVTGRASSVAGLPLHRTTSEMIAYFRFSAVQFVLVLQIYYAAALMHREREWGVAEIIGASPQPDWIAVISKTVTISVIIALLLTTSMLTCVALQLVAGHRPLQVALYLRSFFLYDGAWFFMLGVLAVVLQVASPGKWAGMVLVLVAFVILLALEPLGFEHVLYGFRIPHVLYSDMNGFGHFRVPTYSLVAYWSAFCGLLLVLAHLFVPRGRYSTLAERLADARTRWTRGAAAAAATALAIFVAMGGWIFYNTNVLNHYETTDDRAATRAAYERTYGSHDNADAPSFQSIRMELDLYPGERRLESRGTATLRNNKSRRIGQFVLSLNPRLQVRTLQVERASIAQEDAGQGFYLVRPAVPIEPGDTIVLEWNVTRSNPGFVNADPDNTILENGTFVDAAGIMPVPGYDETREITDPGLRKRYNLPPSAPLPALGDPDYLNTLRYGIDSRTDFEVVFSTAADQTAVAPGELRRQWERDGRRYFEYRAERPIPPALSFLSARYEVARDRWEDVNVEVFHDPAHPWNVPVMVDTAKKSLAYMSREFGRYPLSDVRVAEYPRYSGAARAFAGAVAYSESAGFLTDLRGWAQLDYTTIHELAHQWWGGQVYGARMQGREVLNETIAQYSTFMVFREYAPPVFLRRIMSSTLDAYLRLRGSDTRPEQPLIRTEDQGNISYNKGALVMFALQEAIGADRMHEGLRSFLEKFSAPEAGFPTSLDLEQELRSVAGPRYQGLITDLFEKIMLYDVRVDRAKVVPANGGFDVLIDVTAHQFESSGLGVETEVPLSTEFLLVLFPDLPGDWIEQTPLLQERRLLHSGSQTLTAHVGVRPGAVGVDPFHLMIDRTPADNLLRVATASSDALH